MFAKTGEESLSESRTALCICLSSVCLSPSLWYHLRSDIKRNSSHMFKCIFQLCQRNHSDLASGTVGKGAL